MRAGAVNSSSKAQADPSLFLIHRTALPGLALSATRLLAVDIPVILPGGTTEGDLGSASGCSVALRRAVLEAYFARRPGRSLDPPGLGRALIEFTEWQIDSGRISDGGGSPWWSAVNGRLVGDLASAAGGASGPWTAYESAERGAVEVAQRALWAAHQDSIASGSRSALALLDAEPVREREFIGVALAVVEFAAGVNLDTAGGGLGRSTRRSYPTSYPCTEEDLVRVRDLVPRVPTGRQRPPGVP